MPEVRDKSNQLNLIDFLSNVYLSFKNKHLNIIRTFHVAIDGMVRSSLVFLEVFFALISGSQQSR